MGKNTYLRDSERYLLAEMLCNRPNDSETIRANLYRIYNETRSIEDMRKAISMKLED